MWTKPQWSGCGSTARMPNKGHWAREAMIHKKYSPRLALTSAIVCLLACFSQPLAAEEPVRGGTLIYGINSGDPPTYDCHQSTLFPIIHLLTPHYSNLLKIDTKNIPRSSAILRKAGRSRTTPRPTSSSSEPT